MTTSLPISLQTYRTKPDGSKVLIGGCDDKLHIEFDYIQDAGTLPGQFDLLTCVRVFGGTGDEEKSGAVDGCYFPPYVYSSTDHSHEGVAGPVKCLTLVDIWKALRDGKWTSSTVLYIYVEHSSAIGHTISATIKCMLGGILLTKTVDATEASDACPCNVDGGASLVGVLTIHDDGFMSLT